MSTTSRIEWTEQTWNPLTGCTKISPGCKYCYAEVMAYRLHAMGVSGYKNGFNLTLHEDRLIQPLKRKKPTVYFVNSMSDLFQEGVPDHFITKAIDVMRSTPQHIYQVLTKRASKLPEYFSRYSAPENLWLGVSVENKKHGVPRIEHLRKVSGINIKFLSVEPLLEDIGKIDLSEMDWVIVGGESGANARQMRPEWATSVRRQCETANVSFFFKQWGLWGADGKRRSKKANGRELDGKIWNSYPVAAAFNI